MNIKKSLLVAGAVTSIGAAGFGGSTLVSAETDPSSNNGANSLVTKLAEKFNLKSEDIQAVFDEDRTAKDVERQAQVEKELTQAVTDGKLTAVQKDKIIAKQKELNAARTAEMTANKDKTQEERKAEMDAKRTELEKWATENSIPAEYTKYVMGHGNKGLGGGRGQR